MLTTKKFIERLHLALDELDVSAQPKERAEAVAAMFDVSTQKAKLILSGAVAPSAELIEQMAAEFEVKVGWLAGSESKS